MRKPYFFLFAAAVLVYLSAAVPLFAGPQAETGTAGTDQTGGYVPPALALVSAEPPEKPQWIFQTPESAEFIYFTGMAEAGTEAETRSAALKNGVRGAAAFYGNLVKEEVSEYSVWTSVIDEDSGETVTDLVTRDEKMSSYVDTVVSGVKDVSWYTEYYRSRANREFFKVWVLCRVSRQKAEQDIADFAKNISEPYVHLLVKQHTARSALLMYGNILGALEQNPLHRAVAYYDGPGGRVNLYEYAGLCLNTLAGGISFGGLPPVSIQKTRALEATVTVNSPFESAGLIDCAVGIYGPGAAAPLETYTLAAADAFPLNLPSSRLDTGRYTVKLELLLTEISPFIRKNPSAVFSLEVRPLAVPAAVVVSGDGGGIGGAEQNALVRSLQQGIQACGVPVSLETGGAEQNGSAFTVTLDLRRQEPVPPLKRALVICDAALDFTHNGVTRESSAKRITELDIPGVVREARKFIAENTVFYQKVIQHLAR
ncbi:MAG: hypothetical protein LBK05_04475 [Treponema sp.]|jgi:hypothetical protein|nr:hypothetical protein [Treponema sp.]